MAVLTPIPPPEQAPGLDSLWMWGAATRWEQWRLWRVTLSSLLLFANESWGLLFTYGFHLLWSHPMPHPKLEVWVVYNENLWTPLFLVQTPYHWLTLPATPLYFAETVRVRTGKKMIGKADFSPTDSFLSFRLALNSWRSPCLSLLSPGPAQGCAPHTATIRSMLLLLSESTVFSLFCMLTQNES